MLDIIKASAPARIVNVSSNSHYGAHINFDDLGGRRRYWSNAAYGQSKLANVLFTYELARRLEDTGVTANALHPGFVSTDIGKNNGWYARLFMWFAHFKALSPEEGAQTSIYLASSPEVDHDLLASHGPDVAIARRVVRADRCCGSHRGTTALPRGARWRRPPWLAS